MIKSTLCATLAAVCALIVPVMAGAATTYQYQGNDYTLIIDASPPAGAYTTSMNVTGSFTVADSFIMPTTFTNIAADVLSYSFFDGRNTLTQDNSQINSFVAAVDGTGQIIEWNITVTDPYSIPSFLGEQELFIATQNYTAGTVLVQNDSGILRECDSLDGGSGICINAGNDIGRIFSSPGTWSVVVPIPAAAWLFASGLGLLGWIRRRRAA